MKPLRLPVLIASLLCAIASTVWAADVGTISGRVTDKRTGHAIPFASVSLPAAKRGGLTDSEGQFTLPNVPPGTYEVRVQYLGYRPGSNPSVVVVAGRVTPVSFSLEDVVVHEEKVTEVTAERRLVEVKQGSTMRSVNANEIRNLAVTTVGDVLQQQAGITTDAEQIHIRGGRSDEALFMVNGVANRDLVTGQSTAGQLNARSVAEVNVATGAYDVRYGNALSGVVEIKLKEGGDKRQAGFTTASGSYGGRMWQMVASGPDPVWSPALRLIGLKLPGTLTSIVDLSGSLFETRYSYLDLPNATLMERTLLPPRSGMPPPLRSSYEDSFFGRKFRYSDAWSPSEDNRWAARYGLTWKPNASDKFTYTFSKRIAIDQGFSRTFLTSNGDQGDPAYPWRWAHRIDHAPTIFEDNVQSSLLWRRSLSTTGYTEAQVSRYFYAQRQDVGGKMWWEFVEPDDKGNYPAGDPRRSDYFLDSGDDNQWADRRTNSWGLNWSITQRLHHNEFAAGFEHQFQTVQYLIIEYPWIFDKDGLGSSHDQWRVHPWVGDFFVRDRLEYEGFVANIGVRADYWVIGREAEQALADTTRTNIAASERTAFYDQTYSFFGRRAKMHFSPRIIVSHPISENSTFFFNYGEFTQIPAYKYAYSKLNSISSESFPLQGNPNINPQVSVNYEVGAKHQFLPTAAANLTFFVKDVYDYPSATRVDPVSGTNLQSYFVYLNGHFSRSKGVELEVEKRRSHHWAGKVAYSYQQTKGKSSNPTQEIALQQIGGSSLTRLSEVFVSWNRPHKVTANFDLRYDDDAPRDWPILRRTGINMFVHGESGRAYTPSDITNQGPVGLPSSANAPFQVSTDIKLDRWFRFIGRKFDVSLQGTNVFNNHLIYRVDPITGGGYVLGKGIFDPAYNRNVTDYSISSSLSDPSNYGAGAQWRLQLDVDF
jgi:hypothetical protein